MPENLCQDMNRRRGFKNQIPEEDFQTGPQGLKYYDMTRGQGPVPKKGDRIAVHYEIRWHGVTFMTSRSGCAHDSTSTLHAQSLIRSMTTMHQLSLPAQ